MMPDYQLEPASFRDPSGFLFSRDGILYRQINTQYKKDYDHLMGSGAYNELVGRGWLIPHEEVQVENADTSLAYKIIKPHQLDFISYPYEWAFGQLKDAALLTLKIQQLVMKYGLSLKDSSAYNIQHNLETGRPLLIDTLSFELYPDGKPWVGYRQFCQHFLAPLALMAKKDVRLNQLLRIYMDGIPLDLASSLLPKTTYLNFGLLTHLHLHATAQNRFAGTSVQKIGRIHQMKKDALLSLISNLMNTVNNLSYDPESSDWADYYDSNNYTSESMADKINIVVTFLDQVSPKMVWDLGSNTGRFSRIAQKKGVLTICFDIDPAAVEISYLLMKRERQSNILPLVMDLTNPSAGLGWGNRERKPLEARRKPDMVFALALIHHLAISNNLPLSSIAAFFRGLSRWLVVEFIPKSDSQVQRLLASREDIFNHYSQDNFERTFEKDFFMHKKMAVKGSQRTVYLMERK